MGFGTCRVLNPDLKKGPESYIEVLDNHNMKILLPKNAETLSRVRPVMTKELASKLQESVSVPLKPNAYFKNWNQKLRNYQSRINENKAEEICNMIRELKFESAVKPLNYSQKIILEQCQSLLEKEIKISLQS